MLGKKKVFDSENPIFPKKRRNEFGVLMRDTIIMVVLCSLIVFAAGWLYNESVKSMVVGLVFN